MQKFFISGIEACMDGIGLFMEHNKMPITPHDISRTGAIKSAVFSIIRCMTVSASVTVFSQREKQRRTAQPVNITDRPGGNIHVATVKGRQRTAEPAEPSA
jgi:hypothetical protein